MNQYIPKRGDIVWTDLDPAADHEQSGKHPSLVLSPLPFNKKIMLALVAPITSKVCGHAFEVPFQGQTVSGVVLCHQVKTIDLIERGVSYAENAPDTVVADVLAKVRAIII